MLVIFYYILLRAISIKFVDFFNGVCHALIIYLCCLIYIHEPCLAVFKFKLIKIKTSVPQSHWLRFKCLIATNG